tara:strand:- start:14979 stop:15776 length:798 start_codon:yes stop_codon:yes gene_type:complete
VKNNISNIFSILSNNINITYATDTLDNTTIINEIANSYNIFPLETAISYGIRSSYCLFFDAINQREAIDLAQSNNIEPILVLNHIPQQLQKKEDFYLFNEQHKDFNKITLYNNMLDTFPSGVTLIDRPQISKENIESLKNKTKYDVLIFCPNKPLGQSIHNTIKAINPSYNISFLETYKNIKHLENLYQQVSEYGCLITINDILLAHIALDLNIKTISNLNVDGVEVCNNTSNIADFIKNKNTNTREFVEYDFHNSFKTYIKNLT